MSVHSSTAAFRESTFTDVTQTFHLMSL
uniref:Uncharacterized protein n=1 Tax=Lepeophtheirus salmonis TaxID=72036 RepID=A0A0K2V6L5_LEPSM